MKAVMISIKPKWIAKIASGEKTIEVRKSRPKIETPFKCYIYSTKTGNRLYYNGQNVFDISKELTGKVVGEFICDKIYGIKPHDDGYGANSYIFVGHYGEDGSCLTFKQLDNYLKNKIGFGWHISDLKIYDKPKELSEFRKPSKEYHDIRENKKGYLTFLDGYIEGDPLTRPPQSWCYVEIEE